MTTERVMAQHRDPPFADPHLATAIINRHITRFGPWFPCTAENSLAFLTRTGRKYTLVRAFVEPKKPEGTAPENAAPEGSNAPSPDVLGSAIPAPLSGVHARQVIEQARAMECPRCHGASTFADGPSCDLCMGTSKRPDAPPAEKTASANPTAASP